MQHSEMAQTIRPHANVVKQRLKCSLQTLSAAQSLTGARKLLLQTKFTLQTAQSALGILDRTPVSFIKFACQSCVAQSLSFRA